MVDLTSVGVVLTTSSVVPLSACFPMVCGASVLLVVGLWV